MILEFSLENFRSFKEKQTLSLLADPGKDEFPENAIQVSEKISTLKSALVYGANASGKSNLMRALQALRSLVVLSANKDPGEAFEEYTPFRFNPETRSAPTTFELSFITGGQRYLYSVSFDAQKVRFERLVFYPEGREAKLFVRENNSFEFGTYLKGQKAVVADLTAENQLFLSKAAKNNLKQLVEVFLFFNQDFLPIPFLETGTDSYYANRIAKELVKTEENALFIQNFKALIRSFDTGIQDFLIKKEEDTADGQEYTIEVFHQMFDPGGKEAGAATQQMKEESTGTQKLFVLGGLILRALMNGRVIMIDEFERSLHPLISSYIIQLFHHPKINTRNAQLILATHDTNLLSKDIKLRRDQVYIVEKDKTGASELFSISDIQGVPERAPFEKWYLSGRFGGVPGIQSLNFEFEYQK